MEENKYFTAKEIADQLQVAYETVLCWIRKGLLPATKLLGTKTGYRIKQSDVDYFLETVNSNKKWK